MTQEERNLLIKDLCARLPYGVKMTHIADDEHCPKTLIGIAKDMITLEGIGGYECVDIEDYKPYLFPLSRLNSLTDEQKKTLKVMCDWNDEEADAQSILVLYQKHFVMKTDVIDWLNQNHFDYRGLIEKGLAIDATGLNIY